MDYRKIKEEPNMYSNRDIAVIGIGCRFPDAKDYTEYWDNLVAGVNSIKEITPNRWDISAFYSPDGSKPNTSSSKWCGMLENADLFDNRFFNISAKEANVMDPQQRLLLEETYHCMEDAGVSIKQLQQKVTSVHVGISAADYGHYTLSTDTETDPYAGLGIYKSIAANRLSHSFGFKGISTAVDAACASGLVAISEGYRLLTSGESDFALAAAVSLSLHPGRYIAFSRSRMLSPDGQCKTFDKDANGFVPGEGVGVVLLQRAIDAIREGNHIYAILKGIAVNHGGNTVTITAPRIQAQREVYLNAYAKANITPDTIGYIEAHGTGTSLGDPIEIESLTQAFRKFTDKNQYCRIGSVKTNIGHLEPTAGMAGFIKLALMLKHQQIPKTLNIRSLNPIINFEQTPFIPAFETSSWERLAENMPLRAGVSAFGFGGVNAHALLEECPKNFTVVNDCNDSAQIFAISAKTSGSLQRLKAEWKKFATGESFDRNTVQDICQTLLNSRVPMEYRFGALIKTREDLIAVLDKPDTFVRKEGPVCLRIGNLNFPTYSRIESLLARAEVFRAKYDGVETTVQKYLAGQGLEAYLEKKDNVQLNDFIGSYTLIAGLMELGFSPELLTGEGTGLLVSLVISGMLTVEEAFIHVSSQRFDSIQFSRPRISFYDPVLKQVIKPFYFDSKYIDHLTSKLGFHGAAHYSDVHSIQPGQSLEYYVHKARALSGSQFTFKKFLDEWDTILEMVGISLNSLLYDDELLTHDNRISERLLLSFVIINSLQKLNRKWELPDQKFLADSGFYELLDLVDDEVLSKEDLVELLTGNHRDNAKIAEKLNSRQHNINASKPYRLLRKVHRFLKELGDEAEWLNKATVQTGPPDLEGITILSLGELTDSSNVANSLLPTVTDDLDFCIKNLLLKLWLEGISIDWDKIFPEGSYLKIALPGYPFEGKSFWKHRRPLNDECKNAQKELPSTESKKVEERTLVHTREVTSKKDFLTISDEGWNGTLYYKPVWKEVPLVSEKNTESDLVLIFADEVGIGQALAGNFKKHLIVIRSDVYRQIDNSAFSIDIGQPQHYQSILQKAGTFSKLYFLWGIEPHQEIGSIDAFQSFENRAVKSFFRLCKALTSINYQQPYELIVVTDSVQQVDHDKISLFPYAAPLLGIAKVMALENPYVSVNCIDVTSPSNHDISNIARENSGGPLREIAYREGKRYLKALAPQPDFGNRNITRALFRNGGVYIILGGMGGVGFELSRFLASEYQAKLILVGRRPLGESHQHLDAIRQVGGEVIYVRGDITHYEDMRHVVQQAKERFGVIHGVINSTLELADMTIRNMSEELFAKVLDVKAKGSYILHQVTQHEELDFLVFFSSMLTLRGNPGQCHYVAGCSFQDAYVDFLRQAKNQNAVAINWGYWGETGIVANEHFRKKLKKLGIQPFLTSEGMEGFKQILESGEPRVVFTKVSEDHLRSLTLDPLSDVAVQGGQAQTRIETIASDLEKEIQQKEWHLDLYEGFQEVEEYGHLLLLRAFQKMGVFLCSGETYTVSGLTKELNIESKYYRLFDAIVNILERNGILIKEKNSITVTTQVKLASARIPLLSEEKIKLLQRYPQINAHIDLLDNSVPHIMQILRGEVKATEVLFPNSSMKLVEAFYHGHRFADYYNLLNAKFIKGLIANIIRERSGAKIRILEIGAGTGATSSLVLQNIASYGNHLEYCYTDISHAFVKHGKNQFGKTYPFTTFSVLNIEEITPEKQAELGFCDIIFATNVIHATKNLSNTFKGIRQLMTSEGCLILNECTHVYDFITLTFGLLDGWWLFEDTEARLPFAPLVNPLKWKTLFTENGLDEVRIIGDPTCADENQRQCLIVGQYSAIAKKELVTNENSLQNRSDLRLNISKINGAVFNGSHFSSQPTLRSANSVKNILTRLIAEVLQIDQKDISPDDRFTELGIDSIVGVETVTRINTTLHLDLRTTIVFDYSSINALAAHIVQAHPALFIPHHETNIIRQPETNFTINERPESKNGNGLEIKSEVQATLRRILAKMLDINEQEIGVNDRFSELGIDSIVGVDTVNEINKALHLDLRTTIIFDYSSINELAGHIYNEYAYKLTHHPIDKENTTQNEILSIPCEEEHSGAVIHPVGFSNDSNITKNKAASSTERINAEDCDIAIIGISAKYPGSDGIKEFWENIANGTDSVTEIPRERWNIDEYYDPAPSKQNKVYSRYGGFLSDIDKFDPLFFKISHKEAELMDPQQRLFTEYCWKAIEDAGYSSTDLADKKVGIYVGVRQSDYYSRLLTQNQELDSYVFKGNDCSILTARLAYHLDLKGPSIPIDTACSSSLVAIHLACDQLRTGQLEMAIAGGIFVMTTPQLHIMMCKTNMLSPDGKCKTYDNDANGFVPGEGVGIVILKSLKKALQDGDHIYGIVKGSGINQDGKTNGITAPSTLSQTNLELEVFKQANITPDTITYVEGHGTGTKLGDPIEIEALTTAFRKYTDRKQYCAIGSVKTNIGHTLTAAGVAGVLKVLLAMKYGKIPPSLNFKKQNEFINFKDSPFYVNTTLKDWKVSGKYPRRATVSSFGFSGTNGYLVLEEAADNISIDTESLHVPYYLIPLSAKTEKALQQKIEDLSIWLIEEGNCADISDIAFTLSAGRDHFSIRTGLVVKDAQELAEKLCTLRKQIKTESTWFKNVADTTINRERNGHGDSLIGQLSSGNDLSPEKYRDRLATLAELYIEGCNPDWKRLFIGKKGRRISLPAYPFARESYWAIATTETGQAPGASEPQLNQLHPLVHQNTSTLNVYNFTSLLTGDEFFLRDHVVFGQQVLPGVAYIEMARAAGELLSGTKVKAIKDVVWLRPIIVNKAEKISISLTRLSSSLQYEVFTTGQQNQKIIHGHGKVVLETAEKTESANFFLDIAGIKRASDSARAKMECYALLEALGLKYGPGFQVIQQSFYSGTEVLSWLELPNGKLNSRNEFGLHPGLMDGVLQTVVGIIRETGIRYLPFALEEVQIISAFPDQCYAYAKRRKALDSQNYTFDIQVADENGKVVLVIKGFSLRAVDQSAPTPNNTRFHNSALQQIPSKGPSDYDLLSMLQKLQNGEIEIIEADQITDNIL